MPDGSTTRPRKPRQKEPESDDSQRWLLTYADAITLMLVFFIILYAISDSNEKKFMMFVSSVQDGFSIFGYGGGKKPGQAMSDSSETSDQMSVFDASGKMIAEPKKDGQQGQPGAGGRKTAEEMTGLARMQATQVEAAEHALDQMQEFGGEGDMWLQVGQDDARIVILDSVLFDSRHTYITARGRKALSAAARSLRETVGDIVVEGHTTSARPLSPQYPTNWELSSGKAVLVVRFLAGSGGLFPQCMRAVGRSHHVQVQDSEGPQDPRNARTEIVLPFHL